ncbi:hypothetical protein RvVAR0630_43410 [Agrobacterium vitis]|nr:hypothetical protein RvVAR0630_43410 [Agrobacterium vitis]
MPVGGQISCLRQYTGSFIPPFGKNARQTAHMGPRFGMKQARSLHTCGKNICHFWIEAVHLRTKSRMNRPPAARCIGQIQPDHQSGRMTVGQHSGKHGIFRY